MRRGFSVDSPAGLRSGERMPRHAAGSPRGGSAVSDRLHRHSWPHLAGIALLVVVAGAGCRTAGPAPATAPSAPVPGASAGIPSPLHLAKLDAVLWFQTSEEARQLQRQAFLAARRALDQALADPAWSALGQGMAAASLPVAVIADVDETLLDNSAFEGWMLRRDTDFSAEAWTEWVDAAEARPLAGAVEFARYLAERGVTLFYVTNRDAEHEAATRDNLARVGFPLRQDVDVLLLRHERPEWQSDKESRRAHVAASYRVALLLGDDLNDFLSGARGASVDERRRLAEAAADRFGTSWFVLPNPTYGSWEGALTAGEEKPGGPEEALAGRLAKLRAFRAP